MILKQLTEKKWDNILSQETFEKVVAGNPNKIKVKPHTHILWKAQNEALKEAWANFKEIHGGIFGSSLKKEFDKIQKRK